MTGHYSPEKIVAVPIEELDLSPGPYCMSFAGDLSKLECSIRRIGLIHLPILAGNEQGGLDIVTGSRRLKVLLNSGEKIASCLDFSGRRLSGLELLLFNLYENLPVRTFNDIEKGMILKRLQKYLTRDEISREFLPLLELPAHEEILDLYAGLDDLDLEYREAIAGGVISVKSAGLVNRMKNDEKSTIFEFLLKLKFNKNQQIRFIELIQDLSIIREKPVSQILSDPEIQDILMRRDGNIPQKSRQVLSYLKAIRFPRLTEAENHLRAVFNKLDLPAGSYLTRDPSFEDKDLRLEILFENGPELLNKLKALIRQVRELPDLTGPPT